MRASDYFHNDGMVSFKSDMPQSVSGLLQRLSPQGVVFEVHGDALVLRTSQVLPEFKIYAKGVTIFDGQALVTGVIDTGAKLICECSLLSLSDQNPPPTSPPPSDFQRFTTQWRAHHRVLPSFKLAVADLYVGLSEIQLWLAERRAALGPEAHGEQGQQQQQFLEDAERLLTPLLDGIIERFEVACAEVAPDTAVRAAHRTYLRRLLHPFLMTCPFMHRIYTKPLGYAGDYEMMNMIWRNGFEGKTLFGRLLNRYIVNQAPGVSVRNRVNYMAGQLMAETVRLHRNGRRASIYSIGCGPAREVRNFMSHPISNESSFCLLDFNEETLAQLAVEIETSKQQHGRTCPIHLVRRPAQYLLKEGAPAAETSLERFDLIYSSGLYDYLSGRTALALNTHLYSLLNPGGLLIVSNFTPANPIIGVMEFMFEWFLIHRDPDALIALAPEGARADHVRVVVEPTGCNAFLEVRKPLDAL